MMFQLRRYPRRHNQRGVVLLFCLIVLVILMAGGVAVMRSMNTSLSGAGNLAFRRDLVNQGEMAVARALATPLPKVEIATAADLKAVNYSRTPLDNNTRGIPLALLNDTEFAKVGSAANDITGATPDVQIRYVIDRLCDIPEQTAAEQGRTHCVPLTREPVGGSAHTAARPQPPLDPIYRISMRVSGPRNTQVFLQTTLTKPE